MFYKWINALEFDDFGGFVPETQFVREMGEGYLLASSVGVPVSPAKTTFKIEESGYYRFFIRTKNWCVGHSPDGIKISVDGNISEKVCGKLNVNRWIFEIAGDFWLENGEHVLSVFDTDGWFGRFGSIIITNDYEFTPPVEIEKINNKRREIRNENYCAENKGKFDLITVGAGVAGIVSAIAAARMGLKVALINDRSLLGGNASEEASVTLEGAAHKGFHETGIIYEIKNYRHKYNITWTKAFNYFVSKENNIKLFANMLVTDVKKQADRITAVLATDTYTLKEYIFESDLFVDATGDGWIGYYADAKYKLGREAAFEYGEDSAPENADSNTMSGCATCTVTDLTDTICSYFAEDTGSPVSFKAPDWAFKLPEGEDLGREPTYIDRGHWWLEMPNDYDDVFESEFVRDSMFRMTLGYFDWLKNSWKDKQKAENFELKRLGTYNAKRESRRLIGDYVMTENDYNGNTDFSDAVCYSGWNIDVHHIGGIFSGKDGMFSINRSVDITPIPFRCLYSKNVSNLMMVGRCISVSHIGLGPTRVQLTGASMGQAVGTAAYLCKKYGVTPRTVGKEYISELQQQLLKDGQYIPNVYNNDEKDLARKVQITASSFEQYGKPEFVINGKTRAVDSNEYAWVSKEGLPQNIEFSFEKPQKISQVILTFEMPFSEYPQGYLPQPKAVDLVTDFTVEAKIGNEYKTLAEVRDNFQQRRVIDFNEIESSSVRITVKKVLEGKRAIIPEIRIYK